MLRGTIKNGFEFDSIIYPYIKHDAINVITEDHEVREYVEYINAHQLEQARIVMPDLNFLEKCPSLKYLHICPSYNARENFDFTPLYKLKKIEALHCINIYGEKMQYTAEIDYSKIKGLQELSLEVNSGALNYANIETLKSLRVGGFCEKSLNNLFSSKILDTLELNECKEESLDGIETSEKLQCLYIHYNRALKDISALSKVKRTLKALRIEKCPKIKDFSVLKELENLEFLELIGSNSLQDLSFIKSMKNLKTFIFDFNVIDGDLTPCMELQYVYCDRCRKHYNLKDKDLPKGEYVCGNEDIEEWRRLE